ncbi:MAG TPA: DUF4142 domain-containing protein [Blastocatellia bacterium]|nr:DUF4142 domain-containing protein [Blastocatellia bacterium]
MFKKLAISLIVIGLLLSAGLASAARQDTKSQAALSKQDSQFVTRAAMDNMAEVELGQLAVERASNTEVKEFGQLMVDDHTKALNDIKGLATQKNVTVPTALDQKHQATKDRLSKLSGAEFDKAFMYQMVKDHEAAVKLFERQSNQGKDQALKEWAINTLPTLKNHLQMARDISAKLTATKKVR